MHRHRRRARSARREIPPRHASARCRGRRAADAAVDTNMTEQRTGEGIEIRERIDGYLRAHAIDGAGTKVVPLTGDASDRRYFRIIRGDEGSLVLAVHVGPIEFATLPFANVAGLLQQLPVPAPAILGHSDSLGIVALEDLGDVTLQAHLGAATPTEHAALYRQAVRLIELMQ